MIRANKVKAEFQDAENLKVKLDHKEDDIRELKKALKLKAEELSAQHVRVGMVSTGGRDCESVILGVSSGPGDFQ